VTLEAQRPALTNDEALGLAEEAYGLTGTVQPLPSERDQNFRLTTPTGESFVLKVSGAAEARDHLDFQNAALSWLEEHADELLAPRLCATGGGERMTAMQGSDGQTHCVRLLTWLPGTPLAEVRPHTPALLSDLGRRLGSMVAALEGFSHPDAERADFLWDLGVAPEVMASHLDAVDPTRRGLVEDVLRQWHDIVVPAWPELRRSVAYNDANDHNVLVSPPGPGRHVVGFIDFGDMLETRTVSDPAIAVSYAMLGKPNPVDAAAHVVAGFHQTFPLTEAELEVLFTLASARLATSVCYAARRRATEPANDLFRDRCGLPPCPASPGVVQWLETHGDELGPLLEPDPRHTKHVVFDLSIGSLELESPQEIVGSEAFSELLFGRMQRDRVRLGIGRYDEPRAIYTSEAFAGSEGEHPERRTVHLGLDLFVEPGAPVLASLDGRVHSVRNNSDALDYGPTVILEHSPAGGPTFYTLYGHLARDALSLQPGVPVAQGDAFARVGDFAVNGHWPPHLHFQIVTDLLDRNGEFPGVAAPRERPVWLSLSPDPNLMLRLPAGVHAEDRMERAALLAARHARLGPNLSLHYTDPLHIVRGRGQYLYDKVGRTYLDCVNNVCHVGHSHPRVVQAAWRQMAVLNTNTRYLHENLVRYAERLSAVLPEPLRVCYFVCSGSEANELALRMAREHTGRADLIVLDGAYHGNTAALIDASPYKFDGRGGHGAPPHVHKVVMPDDYRGPYRRGDPECGHKYAGHVRQALASAHAAGSEAAALITETLLGCGGQVELPPGFLAEAYDHARAAGAVCIADEVQVGFGRVGTHFWGFETQGVVPDIVTLGKPIGNGHPLGAVVTTPEIAASFDTGMEYFNTFGGNPVSCAVGLAVLDVIHDEGLQQHALRVGQHLEDSLLRLAQRHPAIGDVRGRGLFLGVEFVTDTEERIPATDVAGYVVERMKDHGILLSTDGPDDNVLKIKPPLPFSRENADRLVEVLDAVLGEDAARLAGQVDTTA
jgi:4-aminobutyrate aminotransferase-like enzyme/Ser/Thr protein kinase RdoA (MazF antagonist)